MQQLKFYTVANGKMEKKMVKDISNYQKCNFTMAPL